MSTDGVSETFTFEFNIFKLLIAEVAYIPDLLAKEHNFFCEAGCKQGESELYGCTDA